jgi:transcriptional regulator with XRE-family HTH domain
MNHSPKPGMIRVADPAALGPALAEVRKLLGYSRIDIARRIAKATGRAEKNVNVQLWTWESGTHNINTTSLPDWLEALGLDLALVIREGE